MTKKPYLSVVIPAYNETLNFKNGVLTPTLEFLRKQKYVWEIIFVDDGSSDATPKLLAKFCQRNKHCQLLQIPHGGRAAAMTKGMLFAKGKFILYTDFDQSTSIDQIKPFLRAVNGRFDLAIGSRGHGTKVRYDRFINKIRAGAFARISRALFLPGIVDTSCGFKLYRSAVAKDIFSSLKVSFPKNLKDAYMGAVDTEILYIARLRRYKIAQIPVDWTRMPATRLHLFKEVTRILRDLFMMKIYGQIGMYAKSNKVNYENWWDKYSKVNHFDPGTRIRKEWILEQIKDQKIKTLIDLGCGSGELLKYINTKLPKKKLFGADVSNKALSELKKRKITGGEFKIDLAKPPKIFKKFDAVISSETIEHLERYDNFYKHLRALSRRESRIIVTTQSGEVFPHNVKMGHIKHFEADEVKKELKKVKIKTLYAGNMGFPFMNIKNYLVSALVLRRNKKQKKVSIFERIAMFGFYFLYKVSSKTKGPQLFIVGERI